MRSKEKSYASSQIEGLEFGLAGLREGNQLINGLAEENQHVLITLITEIERDWLHQIS